MSDTRRILGLLGMTVPIIQAPMAGATTPAQDWRRAGRRAASRPHQPVGRAVSPSPRGWRAGVPDARGLLSSAFQDRVKAAGAIFTPGVSERAR